jgi:hypothetical protein
MLFVFLIPITGKTATMLMKSGTLENLGTKTGAGNKQGVA